jgi:hypothetical protein
VCENSFVGADVASRGCRKKWGKTPIFWFGGKFRGKFLKVVEMFSGNI